MVVVADASVAIRGDLSGFHQDLRGAEAGAQTLGGKLRSIFSPANVIGAAGIFGVGLGVRQLVGYAGDAAAAFSELQQTQRTTDEVFGASAVIIEDWADRAANAIGMSRRAVFQSGAVMGQTLLNMGFSADEAAEKVIQLQQRAAEMAIAFGTTPERAILAITAAMRGERDTIEKFGVSIKQADINSRILALGLDTSTSSAKKNSEALAILDLVLQQTAGRADRFAESTDDVAVKMAQMQAQIENAQAEVGRGVASIQLGAIKVASSAGELWEATGDDFRDFALNFGSQHVEILRLADEAGISYEQMKQRIINAMDLSDLTFDEVVAQFSTEGLDIADRTEEEFQAAALASGAGAGAMAQAAADALKLGGPVIAAEAGKIAGMLPSEIQAHVDEVKQAAEDMLGPEGLAGGILAAQQKPLDAITELKRVMDESLSEAEQIAKLTGEDTVTALTTGLNSPLLVDRLAANDALAKVIEQLNSLGPAGYAAGLALMQMLGIGMRSAAPVGIRYARDAAGMITSVFPTSEPKDPKSPFRGWTKYNPLQQMYDNMAASGEEAAAATRAAVSGVTGALAIGGMSGMAPTSVSLLPSPAAGGNNINVNMIDRVEKRTVEDIGYGLKRLDDLGKLPGSRR